jgi:hypothetical protein
MRLTVRHDLVEQMLGLERPNFLRGWVVTDQRGPTTLGTKRAYLVQQALPRKAPNPFLGALEHPILHEPFDAFDGDPESFRRARELTRKGTRVRQGQAGSARELGALRLLLASKATQRTDSRPAEQRELGRHCQPDPASSVQGTVEIDEPSVVFCVCHNAALAR